MPKPLTEHERQAFLAGWHVGVGFIKAALDHSGTELVLFTIRPDRWLTADFGDVAG